MDIKLLKQILSIPTYTGEEERLVKFLKTYLNEKSISFKVDDNGNIIATKGKANVYPCLVAHTDTVHQIQSDKIEIRSVHRKNPSGELKPAFTGFMPNTNTPLGCGGDDKAGVFICLQLLDYFDNIKVFFSVSEENGCIGTKAAAKEWFKDVGYFIQFDSPENNTMSLTLGGRRLFTENGRFWELAKGLVFEHGITEYQHHSFTDVGFLGKEYGVDCLNLATGYYNLHTIHEYVVLEDVENSIILGKKLIKLLGQLKYERKKDSQRNILFSDGMSMTLKERKEYYLK